MSKRESEVWVQFACAAIANFEPEDDLETLDEVADATTDYAEAIADAMTDAFLEKFGDGDDKPRRPAPRPARRAKKEDED